MGSEVEGIPNPQELDKLAEKSRSAITSTETDESSAKENEDVLPRVDVVSADTHASRSAATHPETTITGETERITQPHSENSPPSTTENDDVRPRLDVVSADDEIDLTNERAKDSNSPPSTTQSDNVPHERDLVSADSEINLKNERKEHLNSTAQNDDVADTNHNTNGHLLFVLPHSNLPKPQTPPGIENPPSAKNDDTTSFSVVDMPAIGKFFRQRTVAIARGISSLMDENDEESKKKNKQRVMEFNLSGLKVVVKEKTSDEQVMKGRISFFSRSNCRDSTAVRKFFRETGLKFVEINVDVYPERESELRERTGTTAVPAIFFNEKLFGGLVALNSLRNSGVFEQKLWKEVMTVKCPDHAPAPPVYGFDYANADDRTDELVGYVKVLRQKLPIQDRVMTMKMKIIHNCFSAAELVEVLIRHTDCGREKAVEIGKQLSKKHFIHHVFGEDDFEDGNHFYRFLEHEPYITGCFNFRAITNDSEPKPAVAVCQRLTKLMSAILESYASDDRRYLDYAAIGKSEEFRRYVIAAQDLQRINLLELSENERLAFFMNLYNAMVIHALTRVGSPQTVLDRNFFYSDFQYVVGGLPYCLNSIKNGILRCNRRAPYSLLKTFRSGHKQLEFALVKMNPLIHFGICSGTKSSPKVRFFSTHGVVEELRRATREFFEEGGAEVDLEKRTVYLTRIIKWYDMDFGQGKDILKWAIHYLDATKAGFLTHILGDGGPVRISYQNYDWSINS
ncbi:uncharacterized protein LOC129323071 [Prosopis cineraria]|uniref:uncharacterized protein LOC129323071 n=1 Tax=Prosopis cineraria TaxID=364024 RepID=UPI00240F4E31|nr:uncharacterized protein LOC129323071 [Prosopis cineraria]